MISVINRLLQLNGSKIVLVMVLSVFLSSCGLLGSVGRDSGTHAKRPYEQRKPHEPRRDEGAKELDTIKLDIVQNPDLMEDDDLIIYPSVGKHKSQYIVELLLPVVDDAISDSDVPLASRNERYIEYYLGGVMAAEQLSKADLNLKLIVHDAAPDLSGLAYKRKLEGINQSVQPDVIIGGSSRDQVEVLAEYAKKHKSMVFSPFVPFNPNTSNNKYFVQLSPALDSYLEAIVDDVVSNYADGDVYFIGQKDFTSRIEQMQQYKEERYSASSTWKQFVVENEEDLEIILDRESFAINKDKKTIFIIPMDYNRVFIYKILTEIFALEKSKDFIVYGLPPWDKFNILYEFYENMQVYIPTMNYLDRSEEVYLKFAEEYFKRYDAIPGGDAVKGYDEMFFIGKMLIDAGSPFTEILNEKTYHGLSTKFRFEEVGASTEIFSGKSKFDFIENRALMMWRLSP